MPIISLITDFGLDDDFVGVMKAVIFGINPACSIIDLTHGIRPHDITEAAFTLASSFRYFPRLTIHVVVVDPGVGSSRKRLLVKTKDYYFVAPDNGVLSAALKQEPPLEIIEISNERYFLKPVCSTFHGRDIFAPVAAHLSRGILARCFGGRIKHITPLLLPKVERSAHSLRGEVIHVDRFGNLISNIGQKTFREFAKGSSCAIEIKGRIIRGIRSSYAEAVTGKPLVLFSSFGSLEIAYNARPAARLLQAGIGTSITVRRA